MKNIEIKYCKGDIANLETTVVTAQDVAGAMSALEDDGYTVLSTCETTANAQEPPSQLDKRLEAIENRLSELESNANADNANLPHS